VGEQQNVNYQWKALWPELEFNTSEVRTHHGAMAIQ